MESSKETIEQLTRRKEYLENMIISAQKQCEKLGDLPQHKIIVHKHCNKYQYYLRSDNKDGVGKYIPRSQDKLIRQILQYEYLQKAIVIMQRELSIIYQYFDKAMPDRLIRLFEGMSEGRKIMINPIETDDKDYIKQWLNVPYEGKEISDNTPEYFTNSMKRVRSKSEIIIANTLNKYNIPYRYEYPVSIKGIGTVYPDFTTLNVRKRKEIYWEHFGLIDDTRYRDIMMKKMCTYEENNIFAGDNLIVTMENTEHPLSVKDIERKIRKYLL